MRSLEDLRAEATAHHVEWDESFGSRELMDALRDKLGVADPGLNIDPMKAKDLKHEIDWSSLTPFVKLSRYFTPAYVVEPKYDGARARVVFGTTANSIPTGRRSDVSYGYIDRGPNFPHVQQLVVPELAGTVLDAEVMMPEGTSIDLGNGKGFTKGTLNTVMAVLNINPGMGVARQRKYGWAEFHVFDILALAGEPVTHLPLNERRDILVRVLDMLQKEWDYRMDRGHVPEGHDLFPFKLTPQYEVNAERLQWLLDQGMEGGMVKHLSSRYVPGGRTDAWLKVKRLSTGDFFIIGSVPGKGRNEGKVGSLKVAYFDPSRKDEGIMGAAYVADVRGFDDATMDLVTDPETGGVKSEFLGRVIEISGQGRTKNERIRHPNFCRWRDDKAAADCDRSQIELFAEV